MQYVKNKKILLVTALLVLALAFFTVSSSNHTIDFSVEVKPILNKKCITCHGGVKKQGGFSVLFREEALAKTKSGKFAIVPGDPSHSEMIRRLTLKDPEERMPYKHEPLSDAEIDILRKWVKQGAKWGEHWAYVPVKPTAVPVPKGALFGLLPAPKIDWAKNDIDYFILDKLQKEHLKPSAQADKATLLRRVSLDIIGMPAPDRIAAQYLQANDDKAYERLVDSLLASPHYGERWTAVWLDLARYADTKGYERDDKRIIWRYRDWLIKALNDDEKYDRFLTEQLAGDLLPNATDAQFIATAFHRNTMTNDEGGTDNEEFRTAAIIDRVNTTWQALMGTTFGCVQCHSHPYDPFKHDEYYQFMAYFNDTRDEDTYSDYPLLRHYNSEDSLKLLSVQQWLENNGYPAQAKEAYRFLKTWQPAINSLRADKMVNSALADTKWLTFRNHGSARLQQVNLTGKDQLTFRYNAFQKGGVWTIHADAPDGLIIKRIPVAETKNWTITSVALPAVNGVHDLYFTYENNTFTKPEDSGLQFDWLYFGNALPGKDKPGFEVMQNNYQALLRTEVPTTPVMMDNPADLHRNTHVFERGNWLNKGKIVQAGVPHSLNAMPANAPQNRLGLAMWLTDKQNPLTARTMINRLWEQLYGTGLVETLEDLGSQGATPTHQELLDYLSYKFMHTYNWSIKKILKEMVMCATYQQDAKFNKDSQEKDPFNKWYARGARIRLSAEQVRDQALSVSGLMNEQLYGPSVMPWQPEGIWQSPYDGEVWTTNTNGNQYRRAVYTYIKRTGPYPATISFDGTGHEVCTVRRIRTNTPLQALVLLNDSVYLEAARFFAYRIQLVANSNAIRDQISKGYKLAMYKDISAIKLDALEKLYNKAYVEFKSSSDKTCAMVGAAGEHTNPATAALVVVAGALLNMDEWITKN